MALSRKRLFRLRRGAAFVTILAVSLITSAMALSSTVNVKPEYLIPSDPPFPLFNPPSVAKIDLGKELFFDPILSGENSVSCASCHNPAYAWTDLERFSRGETGTPRPRRTPSLQDVGWNTLFARDGRVETLEGFILGPIAHGEEMNQDLDSLPIELASTTIYPDRFEAAFGSRSINLDGISQSLATYVRTLRSAISPFDRWIAGDPTAMSGSAKAGFKLFTGKAGCSQCHSGWRFTDQQFHDIGIKTDDKGRGRLKPNVPRLQYAFKTPSLRNVAIRPPYMHNGSVSSLEKVIEHYQSSFISRPSTSPKIQVLYLTVQEKLNLSEFLKNLTDDIRKGDIVHNSPTNE